MKNKQLKDYLGKRVNFRTVWDTFDTANFIELIGGHATFENDNGKIHIKIFNIAQIQLYDDNTENKF